MKTRVYLTYPKEQVKEPLIYNVGIRFKVVTNIRQATVSDAVGLVALELDGEPSEIEKAVKYLKDKGVKVEPIELDIIE
ncbi:MAG: FeS-binding protein [Deltaproteobacteria bacterium RIFCSPLOWO2_02_FULL_53_8]|nr:MAG: FeS-binding protein [Deltaproteobacteria bacterium RIFCSPLOWO2_02_FULL_53_8]